MYIDKLASQIKNDVLSGLKGYHQNLGLNIEQLKDECVNTRLLIIKEQYLKGVLPIKDLLIAINCVDVDCESLESGNEQLKYHRCFVCIYSVPKIRSQRLHN